MGLITGYFVLPADDVNKYKNKLISSESFKVIKDKQRKVKEVKGKSTSEEIGAIPIELDDGDTEENIYPEIVLQGRVIATLGDGRQISHCVIAGWLKELTAPYHDPESDSDDPLEERNKGYMGIEDKFIGYLKEDIYAKFPELVGTKVIGQDEDGNDIEVDKVTRHRWAI